MGKTVLIADDSDAIRDIIRLSMTFQGYQVLEAKDGRDAYEILSKQPCDLLITDLSMPNMSGAELVEKVRGELKNDTLPIIVYTAERDANFQDLINRGANKVLSKPISPIELIEHAKSLL